MGSKEQILSFQFLSKLVNVFFQAAVFDREVEVAEPDVQKPLVGPCRPIMRQGAAGRGPFIRRRDVLVGGFFHGILFWFPISQPSKIKYNIGLGGS